VFPLFAGAPPADVGLGAFYGWRKAEFTSGDEDYNVWLVGMDFTIPITKEVKVLAEVFTGEALADYRGGIGQSYNKSTLSEIATQGGYVNVLWNLDPRWFLVVGAGIDDPDDDDLNDGNRSRNTSVFVNLRYKVTKFAWIGIEYDRMQTDYENAEGAKANRYQMSFVLRF
jgi:hypothetical protein